MTNWEKYFGAPEKVSQMIVERVYDEMEMLDGVAVWFGDDIIGIFWNQHGKTYSKWLQEECSD